MQLALWIALCVAVAFTLRRRIRLAAAAVLALWFLVPVVGSQLITDVATGPLSVHAASWLIVSIFVVRLLEDPRSIAIVLARNFLVFLVLLLVVVAGFVASFTSEAGGGMVLLVDQIVAPILFFLVLLSAAFDDPRLVVFLRTLLVGLVAVVCLVALAQWLTHDVLFYERGFLTQYWFNPGTDRWMGTLDQPLALSLAVSVTAPLLAGLGSNSMQAVLLAIMGTGVLITQSRVGLFVLAFVVVTVVIFAKRPVWLRAALLVSMAGVAVALVLSPLFAGVASRLQDDTGSAEARALAFESFIAHWRDYLIAGQGIGASYRVADQAGLGTSFENPLVMYSIDIGIIFAVMYFGVMAYLVVRGATRHQLRGLTLAGILAIVVPQTYSSLATRSVAGILVWTVLAMVVMAGDTAAEEWMPSRWALKRMKRRADGHSGVPGLAPPALS